MASDSSFDIVSKVDRQEVDNAINQAGKEVHQRFDFKSMETSDAHPSGKRWKQTCTLRQGISQENAKKLTKLIRDEGPKGVKTQITGDEVRVSSKSRDDLQVVQALIKAQDYDFAVQYVNYR